MVPDARHESRAEGSRQPEKCPGNKPRLVPVLWMAWRLSIRKEAVSPALNGDSAKFQARSVGTLILAVQIEQLSKEQKAGLLSKVDFAEYLEVAYV